MLALVHRYLKKQFKVQHVFFKYMLFVFLANYLMSMIQVLNQLFNLFHNYHVFKNEFIKNFKCIHQNI